MPATPRSTYIVLGDDGRHVSLTRGAMPHLDDQREAGRRLEAQGQAGWLVRMDGDYWSKAATLTLTRLVTLAGTDAALPAARAAFYEKRRADLGLPPSGGAQVAA